MSSVCAVALGLAIAPLAWANDEPGAEGGSAVAYGNLDAIAVDDIASNNQIDASLMTFSRSLLASSTFDQALTGLSAPSRSS